MCMSCGCGKPNDKHGDTANITQDDLDRAARAANISREQAAQNIMDCCGQTQSGQTQASSSTASSS